MSEDFTPADPATAAPATADPASAAPATAALASADPATAALASADPATAAPSSAAPKKPGSAGFQPAPENLISANPERRVAAEIADPLPQIKKETLQEQYPGKLVVLEGTDGVGRSMQAELLKHWLEVEGYGVVVSEWKSSQLISNAIDKAKSKNALNTITFSLLYATDLADRLNREIIPALKAGFVVIADRYFHTAFARDVVRGADPAWVRKLYGFAAKPDLVFYLKMPIDDLLKRIISSRGGLDFHESGRDIGMSTDLYQSFKLYQSKIIYQYERMIDEYQFKVIDASAHPHHVQKILRANLRLLLGQSEVSVDPQVFVRDPSALLDFNPPV